MSNDTPHSAVSEEVNKVGRPSQLTPELISKAAMYLTDYTSSGDIVPTVAGLACYLDIPRSSIYNYKGQSNELLDTLEKLEQIQESKLVNGGLLGDFNATIAKLMLSNHGYSEKQVVDNTSSDGSMSPPQPLTPESAKAISKDLDDEY